MNGITLQHNVKFLLYTQLEVFIVEKLDAHVVYVCNEVIIYCTW